MTQVRVLLVDDNQRIRKTLSDWLSHIPGVSVLAQAASGSEALTELQGTWPDLILSDVEMPGMSGFELAHRITEMASGPRVVLMSECDDLPCYETLSKMAGADAYMHKSGIYEPLYRYLTTLFEAAAPIRPQSRTSTQAERNGSSMEMQGLANMNNSRSSYRIEH